jgi:hypothetical protein
MEPIRNKIAESELLVLNLEDYWDGRPVREFDIAPFLYEGLILREKPYREALANLDWQDFADAHVGIVCSSEAIVPTWAFMLAASHLEETARDVTFGPVVTVRDTFFDRTFARMDWEEFRDRIVVVKGCGSDVVPLSAYVGVIGSLQKVAKKVMFGEPCSTVPLWRKPSGR